MPWGGEPNDNQLLDNAQSASRQIALHGRTINPIQPEHAGKGLGICFRAIGRLTAHKCGHLDSKAKRFASVALIDQPASEGEVPSNC